MVVNRIDGDDRDDGPGDAPRDGAVEALVDTAAMDDAESIGEAAMMLGLVSRAGSAVSVLGFSMV